MRCGACHRENKAGRRYCGGCGSTLPGVCPSCEFINDLDDRFCGGCGTGLETGSTANTGPDRRQLTVLFCDLVGSTALSGQLSADDLRDLIHAFQARCTEAIEARGGYVARYMGDGLLAYFGYPTAGEDDAARAVQAGLSIVASVAELAFTDSGGDQHTAEVRVGLATGEVIAGDLLGEGSAAEKTVVGETPNLAARLQALAGPGQVVISPSTRRLVATAFTLEDLGRHTLKGFREPIHAWQVTGAQSFGRRFLAGPGRALSTLVGREQELGLLRARWQDAAGGQGQVVHLTGEAGVGKSRLVAELERDLVGTPHHRLVLQGLAHLGSTPLHPVRVALLAWAGIEADADLSTRRAGVESLITETRLTGVEAALVGELLGVAPDPELTLPEGAEGRNRARIAGLCRLITCLSIQQPLLLVVEDAQWLDPTTVGFLGRLQAQAAEHALLVLITFRPGTAHPWPPPSAGLTLGRLGADSSGRLIREVAGGIELMPDVLASLVARADGVPLFCEELTRSLLDAPGENVPATLRDALTARLDRVGKRRAVAQLAAIIGRSVPTRLLEASWDGPRVELEAGISAILEQGIVEAETSDTLSFKQALMRDVAEGSLLRETRRALHGRVADALLGPLRDSALYGPELVAHHLSEAGRLDEAVAAWCEAADEAVHQWATREAVAHYEKAMALLPEAGDDPALARREADLRIRLASKMRLVNRRNEARDVLAPAEEMVETHDLEDLRPSLYHTKGNLLFFTGDVAACREAHQLGLDAAEHLGDPVLTAQAHGGLGDADYSEGRFGAAAKHFRRCVELAREHDRPDIEGVHRAMLCFCELFSWDHEAALASALEAQAICNRLGDTRGSSMALGGEVEVIIETWAFDGLPDIDARLAQSRRSIESELNLHNLTIMMAMGWWLAGDLEKAQESVKIASRALVNVDVPQLAEMQEAMDAVWEPDTRVAQLIDRYLEAYGSTNQGMQFMWLGWILGEALIERELWDRAEPLAKNFDAMAALEGMAWPRFRADRLRLLAAEGTGDESVDTAALRGELEAMLEAKGLPTAMVNGLARRHVGEAGGGRLEARGA